MFVTPLYVGFLIWLYINI